MLLHLEGKKSSKVQQFFVSEIIYQILAYDNMIDIFYGIDYNEPN